VKRVERWQDSGLTAKEFAAELDITVSSLTYWKLKLRRERSTANRAVAAAARAEATTAPKFLQLVAAAAAPAAVIEVVLCRGVVVRVPHDFHEPTLLRLIETLGER
jgi:hypothetical protein